MLLTAETRWFWREGDSAGLPEWFASAELHAGPPAEPASRVDRYLVHGNQPELGIKLRGGRPGVEIKGLVDSRRADLAAAPFTGPIEIWSKWWTEGLALESACTVEIGKQRWLRAFDTSAGRPADATALVPEWYAGAVAAPARGCNVEVTRVVVSGSDVWWTLGFEAYGGLDTVAADLMAVAGEMSLRRPPSLGSAIRCSYPEWIVAIRGQ